MTIAEKYGIDDSHAHTTQCPRCARNGKDTAKDNLSVYGPGMGAYCHACQFTILSDEQLAERGLDAAEDYIGDEITMTREAITPEENARIKEYTGTKSKDWRGIRDETNIPYGVRYQYDNETGEPDKQFVPTTMGGQLVGYKTRVFPKDFTNPIGIVGRQCDMVGQHRYKKGGRTVLIVGGEVDMLSAEQMLWDYQVSKGHTQYERVAVVSPSVGETGCAKQIQSNYAFFDSFEKIIVGMDNDAAGERATEAIVPMLPKGKVYIAKWSKKDPNSMLMAGIEKKFIDDYYKAKLYVPAGVVGSGELGARLREEVALERIKLPPVMDEINEMLGGGMMLGRIYNIGAASGIGKTVYVDTIVEYLVDHCPYQIGVVSMELSAAQYGLSMLSRRVGRKISAIRDAVERLAFINSPEVQAKEKALFFREDGSHRWHLVDDRDGSIEDLKKTVERLIIECECRVIVLDPLQDILDGLTNEEQSLFLKWQKGLIKSHNVTFININHVRKSGGGGQQNSGGAMISEEDFAGSSTIFKSAAANILLVRDKMNEDPIIRNTTYAYLSKNRDNGLTGPAGSYYYDAMTHLLRKLDDWLSEQGISFDNENGFTPSSSKK